jgi:hypothetical protein
VSGTFFISTDGQFFQGDLTVDIAFVAVFCKFAANMTTVQLNSLTNSGGIAAIEINADSFIPDGCRMFYEVQVGSTWHMLDNVDGGPSVVFVGLPPLLPFRVNFVGTDSVQPALGVASNSRSRCWRPRADFKHISTILTRGTPEPAIYVELRTEAWRGAPYHTFTCKLLHGGGYTTVRVPDVVSPIVLAPDDAGLNYSYIQKFKFIGMGAISSYRLRVEGTTDNVLATFHVAERFDYTNSV